MNKTILLGATLFLIGRTHAQTLDQTTLAPTIGSSYLFNKSSQYLDPGFDTGAGLVWDYSSATSAAIDTVRIMDVASTPMGAQYPDAQYVEYHSFRPGDEAGSFTSNPNAPYYFYWTMNTEGQFSHGMVNYISDWESYSPLQARHMLEFPLELNDEWQVTTNGTSSDLGALESEGPTCAVSASVDASGTLILPSGTYTDVLRVWRHVITTIGYNDPKGGTAILEDNLYEYAYYKAGMPVPLMITMSHPDFGTAWSLYFEGAGTPTGVNEEGASGNGVRVYPIPSTDLVSVNVDAGNVAGMIVSNSIGQMVRPASAQRSGPEGRTYQFSVSDLAPGIYHVNVMFTNGASTVRKFVVAR